MDLLVIILAGAAVSLLASRVPVLQAGAGTAALAGIYYMLNAYVLFGLGRYWLAMVAPPAAMLGSFLVVTAYRQLTEERAKRHIRDMFAHALSPELVDELLENPSLAQLGGQSRRLSFVFSDLGGFTSLSEKLGAEETVRLLNRYFDRMTDVIQTRHGGYLNKFLGDGIFAFFGAPIFQTDHASRAIRSAVDCQRAVGELNDELAREGYPAQLVVRIGISTGQAMVGNCGSSQRMDYTAIGDKVNLAARLEAANKFFGSSILVDETTWQDATTKTGDDQVSLPLARPLGRVYITGQARPLWIWEILGRAEDLDPGLRDAIAKFTRAIELFKQRRYAQAVDLLQACQQAMPNDKPIAIYLEMARQGLSLPKGVDPTPASSGSKGVDRIALPWE
jgi:adenylate cyclase